MYPVLFRIGTFEITSFGVMVALGALVGLSLYRRELALCGLPNAAIDGALMGVVGGLVGAKLLWSVEHLGEAPLHALILSRGGMSWFGGFAGGLGAGIWTLYRRRVPIVAALAAATPGLTAGHAIGRIGCFLVGDDYGRPTSLPWAVAFPNGLPPTTVAVHPTQLYEALALVPLTWWLIRSRRAGYPPTHVLGLYLVGAGATRFAVEFLRVNARIVGDLSVAHLAAFATGVVGVVLLARSRTSYGVRPPCTGTDDMPIAKTPCRRWSRYGEAGRRRLRARVRDLPGWREDTSRWH